MDEPQPASPSGPFPARDTAQDIETGTLFMPKFDAHGLLPCITQEAASGEVLMLAYMNAEALRLTVSTGCAHYFSRSRNRLWKKGETSGHVQHVVEIRTDCDQDVILLRVNQTEAACHTGYRSCFFRRLVALRELENTEAAPLFNASKVYGSAVLS